MYALADQAAYMDLTAAQEKVLEHIVREEWGSLQTFYFRRRGEKGSEYEAVVRYPQETKSH